MSIATISKPYTFTNKTTAEATEVNSDFDTLYTAVNAVIGEVNDGMGGEAGLDERFDALETATTAANLLVAIKTVDGAGSGLDADKVDGVELTNIVKVYTTTLTTRMDITSVIPLDNTIPQNTEGTEVFTVTLTPTAATNKLIFLVKLTYSLSTGKYGIAALFQDTTANALDTAILGYGDSPKGTTTFTFEVAAGTASETTFKVRAGLNSNGGGDHLYINGDNSINPLFGGKCVSSITVIEIRA